MYPNKKINKHAKKQKNITNKGGDKLKETVTKIIQKKIHRQGYIKNCDNYITCIQEVEEKSRLLNRDIEDITKTQIKLQEIKNI